MKVYTRTGDGGTTSLVGGTRVAKDSLRLQAYGTIDELNSWIGLVAASAAAILPAEDAELLRWIQNRLFDLGSLLATEAGSKWQPAGIKDADIECLEKAIDRVDAKLPAHNRFILPGGTVQSANAQVARTVARRAERQMVTLNKALLDAATADSGDGIADGVGIPENAMRFINRLSDYLFILARQLNNLQGVTDIFWEPNTK